MTWQQIHTDPTQPLLFEQETGVQGAHGAQGARTSEQQTGSPSPR